MLHKMRNSRLNATVTVFIVCLFLVLGTTSESGNCYAQSSLRSRLVSVTKSILRRAAEIGMEAAGAHTMGQAWQPFKKALRPVLNELQRRFPNFFLLETQPGIQAGIVAQKAINALSEDPQLQTMIVNGFSNLAYGQQKILGEIDRIENLLIVLGKNFENFESESEKRFQEIMTALNDIRTQLKTNKSVSFETYLEQEAAHQNNVSITKLIEKGRLDYNLYFYSEAIQNFNEVLALDSNSYEAYLSRGNAYYMKREYSLAMDDYQRAIRIKPTLSYAYNNIGKLYSYQKEYNKAISYFDKAITLSPNLADAHNERGLAYFYLKDYTQAIKDFTRLLDLSPLYLDGLLYRAYACKNTQKTQAAIADFKKIYSQRTSAQNERDLWAIRTAKDQLVKLGVITSSHNVPVHNWHLIENESFSSSDNKWWTGSFPDEYVSRFDLNTFGGKYRWDMVFQKSQYYWSQSPSAASFDLYVAADVKMLTFDTENENHWISAGLMFGRTNKKYYKFVISSNNKFTLESLDFTNNALNSLIVWTPVAIDAKRVNRLAVLIDDSKISLYINGSHVGTKSDETYTGGKVGVIIGGADGAFTVTEFDNFEFRLKP